MRSAGSAAGLWTCPSSVVPILSGRRVEALLFFSAPGGYRGQVTDLSNTQCEAAWSHLWARLHRSRVCLPCGSNADENRSAHPLTYIFSLSCYICTAPAFVCFAGCKLAGTAPMCRDAYGLSRANFGPGKNSIVPKEMMLWATRQSAYLELNTWCRFFLGGFCT